MSDKQAPAEQCAPALTRAAYKKPVVKDFGYVGKLTQGGTGTMVEPGMSMSPTQQMV